MLMSTKTVLGSLVTTAVCASLVGCGSGDKRPQAAPPPTPAQQAMGNLETQRATYVNQTQARVNTMAKFSQDLRAQAASLPDKGKGKRMQNAAEDLNVLLNGVLKELADVKQAPTQYWVDEKRDVEKVLSRAESQYSDAVRSMQ